MEKRSGSSGTIFFAISANVGTDVKGKTDASSGKIQQKNHDFYVYSGNSYSF